MPTATQKMVLAMKTLPKPPFQARLVFEACTDSLQDKALAARLMSVSPTIEASEADYLSLGHSSQLYEIPESESIDGNVSSKEMETLYKGTFSRKGSKTRRIYDQIRMAAPNDICPLCGQRVVSTLDHYLAKTKHPSLAVTPLNLVPACSDCNKLKLAYQPRSAAEQTFHPYFDNLGDDIWLVASIGETDPPSVEYSVSPPIHWDSIKKARLKLHFTVYELSELYCAQAAAELIDIRYGILKIRAHGGEEGVRMHLQAEAESRTYAAKNSWKAAMYRAMAESAWFCREGYIDTLHEN